MHCTHTHTVVKFSGEEPVKSKASFGMQVVQSVWDCQTRLDKLDNETPPRDLRVSQADYLRDLTGAPVFTGTFSRLHYQGQSSPTTRETKNRPVLRHLAHLGDLKSTPALAAQLFLGCLLSLAGCGCVHVRVQHMLPAHRAPLRCARVDCTSVV